MQSDNVLMRAIILRPKQTGFTLSTDVPPPCNTDGISDSKIVGVTARPETQYLSNAFVAAHKRPFGNFGGWASSVAAVDVAITYTCEVQSDQCLTRSWCRLLSVGEHVG